MILTVTGNPVILNGKEDFPWSVDPKTPFNEREFSALKRSLGRDYKVGAGLDGLALYMFTNGKKGAKISHTDTANSLGLQGGSVVWVDQDDAPPVKTQMPPTKTSPRNLAPLTLPQPEFLREQSSPLIEKPEYGRSSPILPQQPIAMPPFPEPVKPVPLRVPPILPLGPPPEILIPPAVQVAGLQPPGAVGNKLLKKLVKLANEVKVLKERERDNPSAPDAALVAHIAELQGEMQKLRVEVANSQLAVSALEREQSQRGQSRDPRVPQTVDDTSQISTADHWDAPCPVHGDDVSEEEDEESEEDENREVRRRKGGWLEIWDGDAGMLYYANEHTQESRWDTKGTPFEEPALPAPQVAPQAAPLQLQQPPQVPPFIQPEPQPQQPLCPVPQRTEVPVTLDCITPHERPELVVQQQQMHQQTPQPPIITAGTLQPTLQPCDETASMGGGSLLAPYASVASTSLPPGTVSVVDINDLLPQDLHPQRHTPEHVRVPVHHTPLAHSARELTPRTPQMGQIEPTSMLIPEGVNVGTPTPDTTPRATPPAMHTQTTPTFIPEHQTHSTQVSAKGSRRSSVASTNFLLDVPMNDFRAKQRPPTPGTPVSLHSMTAPVMQQFAEIPMAREAPSLMTQEDALAYGLGMGTGFPVELPSSTASERLSSVREPTPSPPPPPQPRVTEEEVIDLHSFRRLPSPPQLSPPRGPPQDIIDILKHNTERLPKGMKYMLAGLKFHDEWFHDLVYQSLRSYYYCEVRGMEQSLIKEREKEDLWLGDFRGLNCCDQEFDKAIPCDDVDVAAAQLLKDMGMDPMLLDSAKKEEERDLCTPKQNRAVSPMRTRGSAKQQPALPPVLPEYTPSKRASRSTFVPVRSPTDASATSVATSELVRGWVPDELSSRRSSAASKRSSLISLRDL